jgi:hypothetical protein
VGRGSLAFKSVDNGSTHSTNTDGTRIVNPEAPPRMRSHAQDGTKVNTMLKDITRSNVLQIWFAAVVLLVLAGAALGVNLTIGTGALLILCGSLRECCWCCGRGQPPTASDVLYGRERRR